MPSDSPMQKFSDGKVSSTKVPEYRYIPTEALNRLALRFSAGVERRPDGTAWNACSENQECLTNVAFVLNRLEHAIGHCLSLRDKILRGEPMSGPEDDAGAIIWSGAFLCCATRALANNLPITPDPVIKEVTVVTLGSLYYNDNHSKVAHYLNSEEMKILVQSFLSQGISVKGYWRDIDYSVIDPRITPGVYPFDKKT